MEQQFKEESRLETPPPTSRARFSALSIQWIVKVVKTQIDGKGRLYVNGASLAPSWKSGIGE